MASEYGNENPLKCDSNCHRRSNDETKQALSFFSAVDG